ncbi:hypothetical protein ACH4UM_32425 [Streptomyces sp. NPDC020801]|uniref:hypothetical protein n=1 Tax=Streptomyces sp. NPDC020801 TaxID=3365093 RepID=UPI0037BA309D
MRRLVQRRGERSPRERAARQARHVRAQLGVAADIALTAQRRMLTERLTAGTHEPGERVLRGRVTVDDVMEYARQHFGLGTASREQAAAALRVRFELRGGRHDLDTDAYTV